MNDKQHSTLRDAIARLDDTIFGSTTNYDAAANRRAVAVRSMLDFIDEPIAEPMFVDQQGTDIRALMIGDDHVFELTIAGAAADRSITLKTTRLKDVDQIDARITATLDAPFEMECLAEGRSVVPLRVSDPKNRDELIALTKVIAARI